MEQNFYSLCRNAGILAENFLQRELSDLDLTAAQASVLLVILQEYPHGTTVTELHARMGTTKSSLSSLIKSLRQKGYLRAECHETDNRIKVLLPTDKLQKSREKLQMAEDHLRSAMRDAVGENKLSEINETLQLLCRKGQSKADKELM